MGNAFTVFSGIRIHALFLICLFLFTIPALAQRRPIIIEPKARTTSAPVRPVKAAPPTKGVLIVLFDYEVAGKVTVESLAGKPIEEASTDGAGQAQFILKRGQAYKVKGGAPGFVAEERKSKILKATDTVLLKLTAKSVTLNLIDLPQGAQVFIDEEPQPRQAIDKSGVTTIADLAPGRHKLTVKHPEYRDFRGDLPDLKAGTTIMYPVTLDKVAKLTVECLPNAMVLIDGALQGRVEANGKVSFDYLLSQISEHSIRVELLGYQTWAQKMTIKPGPLEITVKLDPIVTSAGVSDFFDNLSLWSAPSSWKIVSDQRNKKLQVSGEQCGKLADKTYRDFQANFTIWLPNGKGASWVARIDREGRNYYLFHLSGPNSTTHTPRRLYTYVVKDGAPQEVSTPIPVIPELNTKGSYTINVTVQGNRIIHTITSNETGETNDLGIWTDTSIDKDKFLYGSFGFRALADEIFTVDDLSLEPIQDR